MQELEKILEEIEQEKLKHWDSSERLETDKLMGWCFDKCTEIIRKHMADAPENDGWIPVEERLPEKEYSTVLCVTDKNHYFVGVYNRKKRFRTGDIYAEGEVIAWMPLEPYRSIQPETCKYTGGACCWPIDQCKDCPNHPGKKCWEQEVNADGK